MRLSVAENDEGRFELARVHASGRVPVIKVDGKIVGQVITADTLTGHVIRFVTDDEGHVMAEPANNREALTERLTGVVEIGFEDRGAPGADSGHG